MSNFVRDNVVLPTKRDPDPLGPNDDPNEFWGANDFNDMLKPVLQDLRGWLLNGDMIGLAPQTTTPNPSTPHSNYSIFVRDSDKHLLYNQSGFIIDLTVGSPTSMIIGNGVTGGASGSVLFIDGGGNLAQDTHLNWDFTNKALTIERDAISTSELAGLVLKNTTTGSSQSSPALELQGQTFGVMQNWQLYKDGTSGAFIVGYKDDAPTAQGSVLFLQNNGSMSLNAVGDLAGAFGQASIGPGGVFLTNNGAVSGGTPFADPGAFSLAGQIWDGSLNRSEGFSWYTNPVTGASFTADARLRLTRIALSPVNVDMFQASFDGTTRKLGFFGGTPAAQQVSGANVTNNVTVGGTNDHIDDFTDLTVYATDAPTIRNDIYQLARKVKQLNDGLRLLGLFT